MVYNVYIDIFFNKESDIMLIFIFIVISLILIPTVIIPCLKDYLDYMSEISLKKNFDEKFKHNF